MKKKYRKPIGSVVIVSAMVAVATNTISPYFDIENKQNMIPRITREVNDLTYSIPPVGGFSIENSSVNYQQVAGSTVGILNVAKDIIG